jgi:hypothetical protein
MNRRIRSALALALAASLTLTAAAAGPAAAADTTVVPDAGARQVTALDGTIVWVTDAPGGGRQLMQRDGDGTIRPVKGAPVALLYRSVDLGRDQRNRLTLTYMRCDTVSRCVARQDDLDGTRTGFRGLTTSGCALSQATAPALWRGTAAYGLVCRRGGRIDTQRSGLYVKIGSRAPKRLPRPADAARFGVWEVTSVDVRGTRVGAVLSDIFSYAVSQTTGAQDRQSFLAAASEGDSDAHAEGLAVGPGGVLWELTDQEHAGDPLESVINRLSGHCRQFEVLQSPADEQRFRATDLAVDGATLHLVVPGTGIVTHDFAPSHPCP